MKKIRTVIGDIPPEQLGMTSVHEHTIFNETKMKIGLMKSIPYMIRGAGAYQGGADLGAEGEYRKTLSLKLPERNLAGVYSSFGNPKGNRLSKKEYYAEELKAFRKAGGASICDCSPTNNRPSLETVQELSRSSGIRIITCVGFYTESFLPKRLRKNGEAAMADDLSKRLDRGQGHIGFLKCAIASLEKNGAISIAEKTAVRVCAVKARETGMSLHIHTAFPLRKAHVLEIADMLESEVRIAPDRVVFCHMDSFALGNSNMSAHINEEGYDISLASELADRGFRIGMDTWEYADDFENPGFGVRARTKMLQELIALGYISNITLGHDAIGRKSGVQNGSYGYTFFPKYLEFLVGKSLLSRQDVRQMTIDTPAEFLAF